MRALMDTLPFVWWLTAAPELSARARGLRRDRWTLLVSAATAWELAMLENQGSLRGGVPSAELVRAALAEPGFEPLPVTHDHGLAAGNLPLGHSDPFDRILAAQAWLEGVPVLSPDPIFDGYGVERIW